MTDFSRRGMLAAGFTFAGMTALPARAQTRSFPAFGKVEKLDPSFDALADDSAVVEDILTGFQWAEGPVWVGGADGYLLASDPRGNAIHRWSARDGGSIWLQPSGYQGPDLPKLSEPGTNGLFLGRGGIVAADSGMRGISRIDIATRKKTMLAERFEGKRFNSPNDLTVSPRDGSIYFSDPPYGLKGGGKSPDREMDYTGVFKLAPDNSVTLIGKYDGPNGIGVSPDGSKLYHTDGKQGWIVHSLDAHGNSVSQKPFIDRAAQKIKGDSGDSLKIDQAGNMWTSGEEGISVINPSGKRIGIVRVDAGVSNCEIGADGYLYITATHKLARVKVKARKQKA